TLFAWATRLLGRDSDAKDVLHDVFLGLPDAMRHYEERGTLGAWLRRITARVALNRMRSEQRRREEVLDELGATQRGSHPIDAMALRDAIETLPGSLRAVFVLKEIEGFSHAEIADLLGITRGA